MAENKKILLSGVKPSGRPHIGNYFGAMRQFVALQEEYKNYIFIADLHALTTLQNREEMRENIKNLVLDYLAIGLDPEKTTLFLQSDIPEISELAWIFNCLTTMPYLMRAHAYKDAEAKNKEINVGVFDYPILMAADILIQSADVVPVGQDQKQHLEIARDTADRFNRVFGQTFKPPEPLITESVKVVPGNDGQKMSKSYENHLPLFASDEEIKKFIMGIVTDSKGEIPQNVYSIHALFRESKPLNALYYGEKKGKYKELKEVLIADIISFVAPLREKRQKLTENPDLVRNILENGTKAARGRASKKLEEVREKVGLKK